MTAAEQYAALKAIQEGARQAEAAVKAQALADYAEHGSDRWRTAYGTVIVKGADAQPLVSVADEDAFLVWVAERYPTEVETYQPPPVTRVRPAFRDVIAKRLQVEDGEVVETGSGEFVGWARVTDPAPPSISMAGGIDPVSVAAKADAGRMFTDLIAAEGLSAALAARRLQLGPGEAA